MLYSHELVMLPLPRPAAVLRHLALECIYKPINATGPGVLNISKIYTKCLCDAPLHSIELLETMFSSPHRLLAVVLMALNRPRSGCRILGSNTTLESSDNLFVQILTFLSSPPDANMPESCGFQDTLVTHCSFFAPLPCPRNVSIRAEFSLCQM